MRAIDTNVLVRLLTRDHPEQFEIAAEFIAGGAWVSTMVLVETVWVLDTYYGLDTKSLALAVRMLLDHERLVVQDRALVENALELFESRPAVGFSDCVVLETARMAGHQPLGTFDRNLSKLPGAERL